MEAQLEYFGLKKTKDGFIVDVGTGEVLFECVQEKTGTTSLKWASKSQVAYTMEELAFLRKLQDALLPKKPVLEQVMKRIQPLLKKEDSNE